MRRSRRTIDKKEPSAPLLRPTYNNASTKDDDSSVKRDDLMAKEEALTINDEGEEVEPPSVDNQINMEIDEDEDIISISHQPPSSSAATTTTTTNTIIRKSSRTTKGRKPFSPLPSVKRDRSPSEHSRLRMSLGEGEAEEKSSDKENSVVLTDEGEVEEVQPRKSGRAIKKVERFATSKKSGSGSRNSSASKSDIEVERSSSRESDNSPTWSKAGSSAESESEDDEEEYKPRPKKRKKAKAWGKRRPKYKIVHEDFCKICQDGGSLICCDKCPHVYHNSKTCLYPEERPKGKDDSSWLCPRCACSEPTGKVEDVLTWKWDPRDSEAYRHKYLIESDEDQRQYMKQPRRLYYVKFKGRSHWENEWIDSTTMLVYHPSRFHRPWKTYCEEVDEAGKILPPPTMPTLYDQEEEEDSLDEKEGEEKDEEEYIDELTEQNIENINRLKEFGDVKGLKEEYFDHGVKPAWLLIQRIISYNKDRTGEEWYLVKWCGLPYALCSWETEETAEIDELFLAQFKKHVQIYKEFDHVFKAMSQEKGDGETKKGPKSKGKNEEDEEEFVYKYINPLPRLAHPSVMKKPLKEFKKEESLAVLDSRLTGLKLHDYQIDGVNWLRHSYQQKIPTVLADEMGLGKTIQAIIFIYSLYKQGIVRGPILIAAPLSTIVNWERELEKWAPDLYVFTYCGSKESRRWIRNYEFTWDAKTNDYLSSASLRKVPESGVSKLKFHVLLTSYEYISFAKVLLSSIPYEITIIDEAHRLKNNACLFFKSLACYNTGYRLCMTGTPLQNRIDELFHLLNFLSPDKFNDLESFTQEFSDVSKEEQVKKIGNLLGPHMLRRLKLDVLKDLPTKSELLVRVELSRMQKDVYRDILAKNYSALNIKGGRRTSLLNILMDLLKCSNHPYLFSAMSIPALRNKNGSYEIESLVEASGKLVVLRKMLRKLKEQGHRVLIFSQMTTLMDILEDFLEGEGYGYERIDGNVFGTDRQEAIDRFNSPNSKSFVFLLSTKAGGLGINLATADTVIIYDQDWNPHNDLQALARAHRIGQKNKVLVFRLVTRNTVEEKITQAAKKKMLLNHLVIESNRGGNTHVRSWREEMLSFSPEELAAALKFGSEDLFKDNRGQEIVYTDEVIERLLDRDQVKGEGEDSQNQQQHWFNEYMESFKVAQYHVNADVQLEQDEDKKEEANQDPNYWKNLLNPNGELDNQPGESTKRKYTKKKEEDLVVSGKRGSKFRGDNREQFVTAENRLKSVKGENNGMKDEPGSSSKSNLNSSESLYSSDDELPLQDWVNRKTETASSDDDDEPLFNVFERKRSMSANSKDSEGETSGSQPKEQKGDKKALTNPSTGTGSPPQPKNTKGADSDSDIQILEEDSDGDSD